MSTRHFAVSMNGQPIIKGISSSSSMSTITKSTKKVSWWTLTMTSSTTPNDLVMEQFASCSVIFIGAIFRFLILWHMDRASSWCLLLSQGEPWTHSQWSMGWSHFLDLWACVVASSGSLHCNCPLPLCSHCWYISLSLWESSSGIWYMKASGVKPL